MSSRVHRHITQDWAPNMRALGFRFRGGHTTEGTEVTTVLPLSLDLDLMNLKLPHLFSRAAAAFAINLVRLFVLATAIAFRFATVLALYLGAIPLQEVRRSSWAAVLRRSAWLPAHLCLQGIQHASGCVDGPGHTQLNTKQALDAMPNH